jgi:uncharacterized membrane protein
LCIPGILIAVISSYYPKIKISEGIMILEMVFAVITSVTWFIVKARIDPGSFFAMIEPMIVGLIAAFIIHLTGLFRKHHNKKAADGK